MYCLCNNVLNSEVMISYMCCLLFINYLIIYLSIDLSIYLFIYVSVDIYIYIYMYFMYLSYACVL